MCDEVGVKDGSNRIFERVGRYRRECDPKIEQRSEITLYSELQKYDFSVILLSE